MYGRRRLCAGLSAGFAPVAGLLVAAPPDCRPQGVDIFAGGRVACRVGRRIVVPAATPRAQFGPQQERERNPHERHVPERRVRPDDDVADVRNRDGNLAEHAVGVDGLVVRFLVGITLCHVRAVLYRNDPVCRRDVGVVLERDDVSNIDRARTVDDDHVAGRDVRFHTPREDDEPVVCPDDLWDSEDDERNHRGHQQDRSEHGRSSAESPTPLSAVCLLGLFGVALVWVDALRVGTHRRPLQRREPPVLAAGETRSAGHSPSDSGTVQTLTNT